MYIEICFLRYIPYIYNTDVLLHTRNFQEFNVGSPIRFIHYDAFGLLNLGFGRNFNQRLDNITLPTGRQSFTFGAFFNQSLDNKTFQSLILGYIYI